MKSHPAEGNHHMGGHPSPVRRGHGLSHGLGVHSSGISAACAAGVPCADAVYGDRLPARVQYDGGQGV